MNVLRFLCVLLILTCCAFGEEVRLFDGKSFEGWEGDTVNTWRIENGEIVAGEVTRNQPRNEFLATVKRYENFDLRLKIMLTGTEGFVNAGVQFRTERIANHPEVSGYQADFGAGYDGALYDESRRNLMLARPEEAVRVKVLKPGEWNEYRIRAEGDRIQLWLNGVATVDYVETDPTIPRGGIIALQIHGDAKSQVHYKEIFLTELPSHEENAKGPLARMQRGPAGGGVEAFENGVFGLAAGDVVVFTGPENVVLEQQAGCLEALLAAQWKEQKPRFRHMGWEGDTVYRQNRMDAWGSWPENLDAAGATVVFAWFGQMEAMDETRSPEEFENHYGGMLDEFRKRTRKVVVISPTPFQKVAPPIPDNTIFNERVKVHAEIAAKLAKARGFIYVDLFAAMQTKTPDIPLTRDGIHFNEAGLEFVSGEMARMLGVTAQEPASGALQGAIITKNRHWFDTWRVMNWAFAYGDRTTQLFGQGIDKHPSMEVELWKNRSLLEQADDHVHALVLGEEVPVPSTSPAKAEQKPVPVALEQSSFKVREGFSLNLFASEADGLVKPLSMRWDARGRLWAACSPTYPQLVPGAPRSDYLLVCEDTDGDGMADKFEKIAEGLTMPMGIEFDDKGAYVCDSTQLIHISWDGKERRVILSGFGTGDSHQLINSIRWGPDGCLWFSQGLHIFSHIETPHGIVRFDRAGLWKYNPRTMKLQGFFGNAVAGANCWGVTFDDWGQVFHCAADNTPSFYTTPGLGGWANPPPYYEIGALAVSPVKGMCLEYINGSHLPPDLQGALLKPVYFNNQVLLWRLRDDGSGFKTEELGELITSSDTAFRPVGASVGPDGAIYVCDWYNPVIGHYQASYRDPKRDRIHGRIWRLTANGRALVARTEITSANAVELLRSPERWLRERARQFLAAHPELLDAVISEAMKADAAPAFLMEALGVLASHEALTAAPDGVLMKCLKADDFRVRAFAVRCLTPLLDKDDALLGTAGIYTGDPHPRVCLEAFNAWGNVHRSRLEKVAALLPEFCAGRERHADRFVDYAFGNLVRVLEPHWRKRLESGPPPVTSASHLAALLRVSGGTDAPAALRQMFAKSKSEDIRLMLAECGTAEDLANVLAEGAMTVPLATALKKSAARGVRPAKEPADIFSKGLSASANDSERLCFLLLSTAWKKGEHYEAIRDFATAGASTITPAEREAAQEAMAALRGRESVADLVQTGAGAIKFIVSLDLPRAARLAAHKLSGGQAEPRDCILPFLTAEQGSAQLAAALAEVKLTESTAKSCLQVVQAAGRNDAELLAVLRKAAGLADAAPRLAYSAEVVSGLIAAAKNQGDVNRGRDLFLTPQASCIACHRIKEEGGITGPNLSAIGRGLTPELITESIFWPNRQVKEGYFLTTITTQDGQVHSGYKLSETGESLTLQIPGTTANEVVEKSLIKSQQDTGSLMPEGLLDWMDEQQRADLLRFSLELGRE